MSITSFRKFLRTWAVQMAASGGKDIVDLAAVSFLIAHPSTSRVGCGLWVFVQGNKISNAFCWIVQATFDRQGHFPRHCAIAPDLHGRIPRVRSKHLEWGSIRNRIRPKSRQQLCAWTHRTCLYFKWTTVYSFLAHPSRKRVDNGADDGRILETFSIFSPQSLPFLIVNASAPLGGDDALNLT